VVVGRMRPAAIGVEPIPEAVIAADVVATAGEQDAAPPRTVRGADWPVTAIFRAGAAFFAGAFAFFLVRVRPSCSRRPFLCCHAALPSSFSTQIQWNCLECLSCYPASARISWVPSICPELLRVVLRSCEQDRRENGHD